MIYDHYRSPSFYNMTTEGHYKEAWNAYLKYMPEEVEELLSLAEISNPVPICGPRPEGVDNTYHTVGNVFGWQEVMTYLMFCIITRRYDSATLEKMIRSAADNRRISKEFLGHIVWSKRRVPAEWAHVYLVATLHGRDSEKLLAWKNLEITATDYPQMQVKYLRDDAWLEILFEKELRFTINGKPGKAEQIREGVYKIRIEQDSEILFG
jgi:hypothetical protein